MEEVEKNLGEQLLEERERASAMAARYEKSIAQQVMIIDQQKTHILRLQEKIRHLGGHLGSR